MLQNRLNSINYTIKHKKAFLEVEKMLLGKNTLRGYFHDWEKIILKIFFNDKTVSKLHRKYSRHHELKAKNHADFVQMVIDWECARYTEQDRPLNAREALDKFYPQLKSKVLPIID